MDWERRILGVAFFLLFGVASGLFYFRDFTAEPEMCFVAYLAGLMIGVLGVAVYTVLERS